MIEIVINHLKFHYKIRYELKTPYRNGTTHIIFEPVDFISKLAALVPLPRVNLTRYHGIFASRHSLRGKIIKSKDGKKQIGTEEEEIKSKIENRVKMTWA